MSEINITVSKTDMGLDQVNNTSDLNKPISTATQTSLDSKVDKVTGKGLSTEDYTTTEKNKLASITEIFTTALKSAYDGAVTWISTNGTNVLNHLSSTSNPHNVTKTQVGLSNVVNTDTTTTANITDSTNKRFVTDANLTTIGNQSGTNTGDETVTTIKSKLGITTLSGSNTGDQDLSGYATTSSVASKANYAIGGSGSVIDFTTPTVFNSPASPSSANLTDDLTNARIGVVQKIYSNKSVEPTYPAGWVKVGTGSYTTSALNIIFVEWVSGTRCEYWITKPAS